MKAIARRLPSGRIVACHCGAFASASACYARHTCITCVSGRCCFGVHCSRSTARGITSTDITSSFFASRCSRGCVRQVLRANLRSKEVSAQLYEACAGDSMRAFQPAANTAGTAPVNIFPLCWITTSGCAFVDSRLSFRFATLSVPSRG